MSRFWYIALLAPLLCAGCGEAPSNGPSFAVTIHPLYAIVSELCAGRAEVHRIMQPGTSPHIYEPRPSDARAASQALALLYVARDIDGWALDVPARERIGVAGLLPEPLRLPYAEEEHAHGEDGHDHDHDGPWNPHFWGDPRAVQALLPVLVERLTALDPEGAATYTANAERFENDLRELEAELDEKLAPLRDRAVAVLHPSWDYFYHRFGIQVAGTVTPFPGKEPTAKYLNELLNRLAGAEFHAICTEPQLARRPAEVVAEAYAQRTGAEPPVLCEIDPVGGIAGRESYAELLRHNAAQLEAALQ